jgi:hypothetical protein
VPVVATALTLEVPAVATVDAVVRVVMQTRGAILTRTQVDAVEHHWHRMCHVSTSSWAAAEVVRIKTTNRVRMVAQAAESCFFVLRRY